MATISRAFLEIGANTEGLKRGLEEATRIAEQNGAKLSSAGKAMVLNFENALNPTKQLATQIEALEKAGYSAAQIEGVLGDKIRYATEQARAHKQPIDDMVAKYTHLSDRLGPLGDKLTSIGKNLSMYVTLPMVGAAGAALKLAGDFEQTKIAFETMLGSGVEAQAFLEELEAFAARTPFEFADLTQAAKRMMALGFEAKQVVPTLTTIGDAVAGLGGGAEMISRVTLALGQMQAKGKVSAEEMRQLAEAGIPAWQMLADKIGVSIPQAMKMAEKGMIQASVALPAILSGMNDEFGGLMEKQSQTFTGQLSNLKDELFFTMRDLGESLLPLAKDAMDGFVKPMVSGLKDLAEWFSGLSEPAKNTIIVFGGVVAAAGPLLVVLGSMASGLGVIIPLLPAFASGLTGVAASMTGAQVAAAGLGMAVTGLGVAFAGWKIAEWIDSLDLFNRHATIAADKASAMAHALRDEAKELGVVAGIRAEYNDYLEQGIISENTLKGIIKDTLEMRPGESVKDYANRMKELVETYKSAHTFVGPVLKDTKDHKNGVSELSDELKKLKEETEKTLRPADELAEKLRKQLSLGFSQNQLVARYKDEIIKATEKQLAMTGQVSEATAALYEMAVEMDSQKNRTIPDYGGAVIDMTVKLGNMGASLGEIKTKFDDLPLTVSKDRMIDVVNEAGNVDERFKHLASDQGGIHKSKEKMTEFGQTVSTTLTNMTQEIADKVTGWAGPFQDFASAALSALMEGLFKPLISELTSVGNRIGNWIGGLLSGKGGGFSLPGISLGSGKTGGGIGGINIGVGDIGKTIGGWLGLGGGSAIGIGGTATGAGLAGITAGAGATEAGFLAGMSGVSSTTGAAAGGSAFLSSLGAFASNPITIGVAAAGALAYFGYKWATGPNSYEALAEETSRDLGVNVSPDQVEAFMNAAGIKENKAWDHRVEIEQSPMFMAWLLSLGKKPRTKWEAFQGPLAWGATQSMWGPYNDVYSRWLGEELKVTAIPWQSLLVPGGKYPEGVNPWEPANIPKYEKGTDYVTHDQLAFLHKGEAVIPAAQNRPGPQITINGPIYGFDDFKRRVAQAIKQAYNDGGLSYLRA